MAVVAKKSSKTPVLAPTRYGVLYRLLSGVAKPTAQEILEVLGPVVLKTLPQVAQAFGLSPHTINQSWRQAGMPGVSGGYDLAKVLEWRLSRDFDEAEKSRAKPLESKEKLERRKLELQIEREEMSLLRERDLLVDRQQVEAEAAAHVSVAREALLSIPRAIEVAYGTGVAAECERLIRHQLTALSEKHEREFMREGGKACL